MHPSVPTANTESVIVDPSVVIYHPTFAQNPEALQQDHSVADPIKQKCAADIKAALASPQH